MTCFGCNGYVTVGSAVWEDGKSYHPACLQKIREERKESDE